MSVQTITSNAVSQSAVQLQRRASKRKPPKDLTNFKKEIQMDGHFITIEEAITRYKTNLTDGLSPHFADELLFIHGLNSLMTPHPKSRWLIFAEYMFGGFSILLWIGAILSYLGYTIDKLKKGEVKNDQLYLATVLIVVIVVTGLFGFYQETANTAIMESFKKMVPKYAAVIRDGRRMQIMSEHVVIGDIVVLTSGDLIPADVRVIESQGMKVDNSSITGESDPLLRKTTPTDKNPLESENVAFYGTNVVEGSGKGLVIACGDHTLMGHIAGLTSGLQAEETPIKRELKYFIKIITLLAVAIGITFFIIALVIGYDFFEAFVFLIAIIVANVPEGLLVTMTASLTLTARRMSDKNCMVKNLQSIETLGSTTTICSDKTGTLTQNRMTVSHMYYDGQLEDVLSGEPPSPTPVGFKALCRVGILCNRAEFLPNQSHIEIKYRKIAGDASESGVLKCMETMVGNTKDIRLLHPKICEIPFNSTNKYQLSIHDVQDRSLLVIKGAPERVLDKCSTLLLKGDDIAITGHWKKSIDRAILEMGTMGERVLAFADLMLTPSRYPVTYQFDATKVNFPTSEFRFVGLMSMIDPPKPGVLEAVSKCKTAGIRVVMVTGDHPVTAMAIAKKVGIISPESLTTYDLGLEKQVSLLHLTREDRKRCPAAVVTGGDLRDMSEKQLKAVCAGFREIVFARTSPQQKLKIVECFQSLKEIVAVTGDGVNDSPALKKADIGIAMGISGSEVSKEAADMIILDDNFATIVNGVEEGRLIFDNLKKCIFYMLTSNVPEVVPFMMFVTINIPQALSIMAIILIDVGTDLWPGISLAYEKPESDIMRRKPRDMNKDKLVNNRLICMTYLQVGVLQTCAGFTSYFFLMATHGFYINDLIGIRVRWEAEHVNDVLDSFGREWSYEERMYLEKKSFAAFFLAIVVTQIADLFICKTRKLSVFQQGAKNWVMNAGVIFEIFIAILAVYCPGVNSFLQMAPIDPIVILPAVPFALIILVYDEIRKLIIRHRPGGWMERETYY